MVAPRAPEDLIWINSHPISPGSNIQALGRRRHISECDGGFA